MENDRIVGYKPRSDYETEITSMMERTFQLRTAGLGCALVRREGVEP